MGMTPPLPRPLVRHLHTPGALAVEGQGVAGGDHELVVGAAAHEGVVVAELLDQYGGAHRLAVAVAHAVAELVAAVLPHTLPAGVNAGLLRILAVAEDEL